MEKSQARLDDERVVYEGATPVIDLQPPFSLAFHEDAGSIWIGKGFPHVHIWKMSEQVFSRCRPLRLGLENPRAVCPIRRNKGRAQFFLRQQCGSIPVLTKQADRVSSSSF